MGGALEYEAEHDSQHAPITPIAAKVGCAGETPRSQFHEAECDAGLAEARPMLQRHPHPRIGTVAYYNRQKGAA